MEKQVQQSRPNVPTNPDRSCTYLVLRAHSDEHYVQLKPALEFPKVVLQVALFGPTLRGALAQGGLNKDDPWAPKTRGKNRLGGKW